jgi:hypothetical protein
MMCTQTHRTKAEVDLKFDHQIGGVAHFARKPIVRIASTQINVDSALPLGQSYQLQRNILRYFFLL